MKVAISSTGTSFDSEVDARFGRCPYFIIYDTDSDSFEHIENQARGAMGGAGIQAAQMLINRGVEAVITGNVGPNAYRVLSSSPLRVYSGVTGTVRAAIERFKKGELTLSSGPDVSPHFGMK
ncbi:MAG: NifB/NifX family molybdenum-iron cluster-binding protein [Actinobacteria bacterium]|nr:NifB/NifX family molybdenum-iron cluster-binding protein [Actinomycetota bacterium]